MICLVQFKPKIWIPFLVTIYGICSVLLTTIKAPTFKGILVVILDVMCTNVLAGSLAYLSFWVAIPKTWYRFSAFYMLIHAFVSAGEITTLVLSEKPTPTNPYYYSLAIGSVVLLAGIFGFFDLEESPEKSKYLVEPESHDVIQTLELDRGLLSNLKKEKLKIKDVLLDRNTYLLSYIYRLSTLLSVVNHNLLYSVIQPSEGDTGSLGIWITYMLAKYTTFVLGPLLFVYKRTNKYIRRMLVVMSIAMSVLVYILQVKNRKPVTIIEAIFLDLLSTYASTIIEVITIITLIVDVKEPRKIVFSVALFFALYRLYYIVLVYFLNFALDKGKNNYNIVAIVAMVVNFASIIFIKTS
ncbi:hypothetical protein BB559_001659 [Furculomyces boomerangus]|uniref:Major facilitator superfamily associated domain-containing protein n=1 Tax=Furculomyces boomerangus TaxID=61424 RepID=A0A2T9Z174_9FUNG|nr:hypothetical protein BB559_001659 [Furculomyces boomerangus]